MVRGKILLIVGLVTILALVSAAQTDERREAGPPRVVVVQPQPQPPVGPGPAYQVIMDPKPGFMPPQPPVGPGPIPLMRMREYAEQLRARAREVQELADGLRRQADELDQMAMRQMDRGRGPQDMERVQREMAEIKEAIGRAEREGRQQEAAELRQRADQLMRSFQPMRPGPGMGERPEIKGQIERLRDEAQKAKEQGRAEQSERFRKEADRLEQQLREQGPRPKGEFGKPMPPEIQDILKAADQAEREGRMEDARRQREKAEAITHQLQEQNKQGFNGPGPRGGEPQEIKGNIGRLRDEAQKAKDQGRFEDADRLSKEAGRLEQQWREQGPRGKGEFGKPMAPEVQDILRSAEQAQREGRMDDARRQREKAQIVARQLQEQKGQGPKQPGPQYKDELIRGMEDLKKEIGRLWQTVNELRNRPKEGKPA
jgi:hypothetical protein